MRWALTGFVLLLAAGLLPVGPLRAQEEHAEEEVHQVTIPLRFRVAEIDGVPVRDQAWIDSQVMAANRVFAPTGVQFESMGALALPERHARIMTVGDRHQLGRHIERALVNVFVVGSMVDINDGQTPRRGVHWRLPWRQEHHYLVLTAIGPPTTLAHELGHYFGNRMHSRIPGNIMSYNHGDQPAFSDVQQRKVVRAARRYLARRELYSASRFRELVQERQLPEQLYPEAVRAVGGTLLAPEVSAQ